MKNDLGILTFGRKMGNIGDEVQLVGFLNALKRAGVDYSDFIDVDGYDINSYEKDIAYILFGYLNYNYPLDIFPVSKKEHPVCISAHLTDEKRIRDLKELGDELTLFGCRDYATYNFVKLRFPHLPVFVSGCFSLVQGRREKEPENGVPYFVDVPKELMDYIPPALRSNAKYATHNNFYFGQDNKEANKKSFEYASKWLMELKEKASIVVTSRFHCALPCVAMGIPVVVARNYTDDTDRYTGYERFFHVYMPDEYDRIDWNPGTFDIEWVKDRISEETGKIIPLLEDGSIFDKDVAAAYAKEWEDINAFFVPKEYCPYYVGDCVSYISYDQKLFFFEKRPQAGMISYITGKKPEETTLIVYGAGNKGTYFVDRYQKEISRYKDFFYIDSNPELWGKTKKDYPVKEPAEINKYKGNCIVIVAVKNYYEKNGREISSKLANEFKLTEGKDFLMLDKLDNSQRLELTECVLSAPLM